MAQEVENSRYPHSLTFNIPLPTPRLASAIHEALIVDRELSPLVRRDITISTDEPSILLINFKAATARVLRVSANGCMESLNLVLRVCGELDEEAMERSYE